MGVKIQRPGEPGHPGGNRRIYVRVNHGGHRKTRVFNSTKSAERYATDVEALLKLGKVDDVFTAPTPTFQEAADRWLAVDGATMKAGTLDTYRNVLKKHLLPTLGPRPIDRITRADVESWWASVLSKKFSRQRLTHIRGVAAGILRRAVASGIIPSNPLDTIAGRLGRDDREVRQAEWLTERELAKLLRVAEAREPRLYPILLTLASTGIRLGEAMGLQVGDVDLERGKFSIRRAVRKFRLTCPQEREAPNRGCSPIYHRSVAALD